MKFESKIIRIYLFLSFALHSYNCENSNVTAIVILHGTGESINGGQTNGFYNDLTRIIADRGLNNFYKIIKLGLSDDDSKDHFWSSFTSLHFQANKLCDYVKQDKIRQQLINSNRIVLVGCSQGAVLMRGLLRGDCLGSLISKVDKFITFGGPNSGVFGLPPCSQFNSDNQDLIKACNLLQQIYNMTKIGPAFFDPIMYGPAQAVFSPASYWNNPKNLLQLTTYLALIDNKLSVEPKNKYLCKLNRGLDLIAFDNEEIVVPNISAHFGFWDFKGQNPVPYTQTDLYKNDWIGLKILDQNNLITFHTIPKESHMSIPYNFTKNEFLNIVNNNNGKSDNLCNHSQSRFCSHYSVYLGLALIFLEFFRKFFS
jgi:palmitoyl-protein thioesterase